MRRGFQVVWAAVILVALGSVMPAFANPPPQAQVAQHLQPEPGTHQHGLVERSPFKKDVSRSVNKDERERFGVSFVGKLLGETGQSNGIRLLRRGSEFLSYGFHSMAKRSPEEETTGAGGEEEEEEEEKEKSETSPPTTEASGSTPRYTFLTRRFTKGNRTWSYYNYNARRQAVPWFKNSKAWPSYPQNQQYVDQSQQFMPGVNPQLYSGMNVQQTPREPNQWQPNAYQYQQTPPMQQQYFGQQDNTNQMQWQTSNQNQYGGSQNQAYGNTNWGSPSQLQQQQQQLTTPPSPQWVTQRAYGQPNPQRQQQWNQQQNLPNPNLESQYFQPYPQQPQVQNQQQYFSPNQQQLPYPQQQQQQQQQPESNVPRAAVYQQQGYPQRPLSSTYQEEPYSDYRWQLLKQETPSPLPRNTRVLSEGERWYAMNYDVDIFNVEKTTPRIKTLYSIYQPIQPPV